MRGAAPVQVRRALAAWYLRHGRELCFRGRRDPWSVLVSEVMAQQTQVTRVEPAWATFLEAFPTPAALAAASPADALRAWAGLGYNRRAVNLRRAAAEIVERHGGQVPEGRCQSSRRCRGSGRTRHGRWPRSPSSVRSRPWIPTSGESWVEWWRATGIAATQALRFVQPTSRRPPTRSWTRPIRRPGRTR